MMSRAISSVLLLAFLVVPVWTAERGFLQRRNVIDSRSSVQGILNQVLGSASGVESTALAAIEAKLSPLFQSLPKMSTGKVSAVYMKLAVQRYFRQTYGWLVNGFEPNANISRISEPNDTATRILGSETPGYVEKVIEKMLSKGGFTLHDIVVAVATVERLIKNEVVKDVENAYDLNSMATTDHLSESSVTKILSSYYIVEHLDGNSTDQAQHELERMSIEQYYVQWADVMAIIDDIVHNDAFQQQASRNPFAARSFAFESVVRMTQLLNKMFGPFTNQECHAMKERFAMIDWHETGRVKLSDFYKATPEYAWPFLESDTFLHSVGSLDNSSEYLGPQVIIPNYLSNSCLSPSVYFNVCCLNECDGIFQHIEAFVKKPTASAAEITQAIEGGIAPSPVFSSSVPLEPRNLSAPLQIWLQDIAKLHNDAIPLHGRLLSQWLHFAFPRECPYPHLSSSVKIPRSTKSKGVEAEKVREHINSDLAKHVPSPEAGLNMWSLEEELLEPFHSHHQFPAMRTIIACITLLAVASIVLKELAHATRHFAMGAEKEKVVITREHYV